MTSPSLLSATELRVHYATAAGTVQAVRGVDLQIGPGETVGLVGESGCGKSSLGKALLRLAPVSGGRITLDGQDITSMSARALRPLRPKVQMVFQDPHGSLNPRHRVGHIIAQPLQVAGWPRANIEARVAQLLQQVGLAPEAAGRFPHEFSGGQRQRVGIARALALQPKLLVCDEPVSALDVSVRAQVINLLQDLQAELGMSYLFISHDLSVVRHLCARVLVMYLGRIVESGDTDLLWRQPAHPYTRVLLAAAPHTSPRDRHAERAGGEDAIELPSPLAPPQGCAFRARCPHALPRCATEQPLLRSLRDGRRVACHADLPIVTLPDTASPATQVASPFHFSPAHHAATHQPG